MRGSRPRSGARAVLRFLEQQNAVTSQRYGSLDASAHGHSSVNVYMLHRLGRNRADLLLLAARLRARRCELLSLLLNDRLRLFDAASSACMVPARSLPAFPPVSRSSALFTCDTTLFSARFPSTELDLDRFAVLQPRLSVAACAVPSAIVREGHRALREGSDYHLLPPEVLELTGSTVSDVPSCLSEAGPAAHPLRHHPVPPTSPPLAAVALYAVASAAALLTLAVALLHAAKVTFRRLHRRRRVASPDLFARLATATRRAVTVALLVGEASTTALHRTDLSMQPQLPSLLPRVHRREVRKVVKARGSRCARGAHESYRPPAALQGIFAPRRRRSRRLRRAKGVGWVMRAVSRAVREAAAALPPVGAVHAVSYIASLKSQAASLNSACSDANPLFGGAPTDGEGGRLSGTSVSSSPNLSWWDSSIGVRAAAVALHPREGRGSRSVVDGVPLSLLVEALCASAEVGVQQLAMLARTSRTTLPCPSQHSSSAPALVSVQQLECAAAVSLIRTLTTLRRTLLWGASLVPFVYYVRYALLASSLGVADADVASVAAVVGAWTLATAQADRWAHDTPSAQRAAGGASKSERCLGWIVLRYALMCERVDRGSLCVREEAVAVAVPCRSKEVDGAAAGASWCDGQGVKGEVTPLVGGFREEGGGRTDRRGDLHRGDGGGGVADPPVTSPRSASVPPTSPASSQPSPLSSSSWAAAFAAAAAGRSTPQRPASPVSSMSGPTQSGRRGKTSKCSSEDGVEEGRSSAHSLPPQGGTHDVDEHSPPSARDRSVSVSWVVRGSGAAAVSTARGGGGGDLSASAPTVHSVAVDALSRLLSVNQVSTAVSSSEGRSAARCEDGHEGFLLEANLLHHVGPSPLPSWVGRLMGEGGAPRHVVPAVARAVALDACVAQRGVGSTRLLKTAPGGRRRGVVGSTAGDGDWDVETTDSLSKALTSALDSPSFDDVSYLRKVTSLAELVFAFGVTKVASCGATVTARTVSDVRCAVGDHAQSVEVCRSSGEVAPPSPSTRSLPVPSDVAGSLLLAAFVSCVRADAPAVRAQRLLSVAVRYRAFGSVGEGNHLVHAASVPTVGHTSSSTSPPPTSVGVSDRTDATSLAVRVTRAAAAAVGLAICAGSAVRVGGQAEAGGGGVRLSSLRDVYCAGGEEDWTGAGDVAVKDEVGTHEVSSQKQRRLEVLYDWLLYAVGVCADFVEEGMSFLRLYTANLMGAVCSDDPLNSEAGSGALMSGGGVHPPRRGQQGPPPESNAFAVECDASVDQLALLCRAVALCGWVGLAAFASHTPLGTVPRAHSLTVRLSRHLVRPFPLGGADHHSPTNMPLHAAPAPTGNATASSLAWSPPTDPSSALDAAPSSSSELGLSIDTLKVLTHRVANALSGLRVVVDLNVVAASGEGASSTVSSSSQPPAAATPSTPRGLTPPATATDVSSIPYSLPYGGPVSATRVIPVRIGEGEFGAATHLVTRSALWGVPGHSQAGARQRDGVVAVAVVAASHALRLARHFTFYGVSLEQGSTHDVAAFYTAASLVTIARSPLVTRHTRRKLWALAYHLIKGVKRSIARRAAHSSLFIPPHVSLHSRSVAWGGLSLLEGSVALKAHLHPHSVLPPTSEGSADVGSCRLVGRFHGIPASLAGFATTLPGGGGAVVGAISFPHRRQRDRPPSSVAFFSGAIPPCGPTVSLPLYTGGAKVPQPKGWTGPRSSFSTVAPVGPLGTSAYNLTSLAFASPHRAADPLVHQSFVGSRGGGALVRPLELLSALMVVRDVAESASQRRASRFAVASRGVSLLAAGARRTRTPHAKVVVTSAQLIRPPGREAVYHAAAAILSSLKRSSAQPLPKSARGLEDSPRLPPSYSAVRAASKLVPPVTVEAAVEMLQTAVRLLQGFVEAWTIALRYERQLATGGDSGGGGGLRSRRGGDGGGHAGGGGRYEGSISATLSDGSVIDNTVGGGGGVLALEGGGCVVVGVETDGEGRGDPTTHDEVANGYADGPAGDVSDVNGDGTISRSAGMRDSAAENLGGDEPYGGVSVEGGSALAPLVGGSRGALALTTRRVPLMAEFTQRRKMVAQVATFALLVPTVSFAVKAATALLSRKASHLFDDVGGGGGYGRLAPHPAAVVVMALGEEVFTAVSIFRKRTSLLRRMRSQSLLGSREARLRRSAEVEAAVVAGVALRILTRTACATLFAVRGGRSRRHEGRSRSRAVHKQRSRPPECASAPRSAAPRVRSTRHARTQLQSPPPPCGGEGGGLVSSHRTLSLAIPSRLRGERSVLTDIRTASNGPVGSKRSTLSALLGGDAQ